MEPLSAVVKQKRKSHGMTQQDLSQKSGLGLRLIREIEQGKKSMRMDKVNQLLALFGMELTPVATTMRTNIELDDVLVEQALKLSNIKTKKDVIQEALKNYVAWMKKKQLLDLKGKVKWEGNLKDMRSI
jgi:y4mF family transcriptional regulator